MFLTTSKYMHIPVNTHADTPSYTPFTTPKYICENSKHHTFKMALESDKICSMRRESVLNYLG